MKHLLATISCGSGISMDDERRIFNLLLEACHAAGCSVIGNVQHSFYPVGFSAVILIGESHVSIHTWPERNEAKIDFFSCGEHPKFDMFLDCLSRGGYVIRDSAIIDRTNIGNIEFIQL